jgi:5-deoxy-glucuronate isomerase
LSATQLFPARTQLHERAKVTLHITDNRDGFAAGLSWVTTVDDETDNTGIAFGVLKLQSAEHYELHAEQETALLLMVGNAEVTVAGTTSAMSRDSLFDQAPYCLHIPTGTSITIHCHTATEFTLYQTANKQFFEPRAYRPEDVEREQRGKGQVADACWREVRTIFDGRNAPADAELVLGEVITLPGRWSSYPPHHHPQPEIYHYRFTRKQGYGHAELGDDVYKVRQYDTVKILDLNDHAQVAAPGYGMYYSWVIRHLPGEPYTVPEFTQAHQWIMKPDAEYWQPDDS